MGNHDLYAHAAFGDTNRADSVPDFPVPSEGPMYLEGRLVLSLSFQGGPIDTHAIPNAEPLEFYELWDDFADKWLYDGLVVLRFEDADIVARSWPWPTALWKGAVDTRARVIPVLDLDEAGMIANRECDLCWKRV